MSVSETSRDSVPIGTPGYQLRAADAMQDEDIILRLWRAGGIGSTRGIDRDRARFKWFYCSNPQGAPCLNLLLHGSEKEAVGFLGIGPRSFLIDGHAVAGGTLVDFVVSPKHRSAFPALFLQRQGREAAWPFMQLLYGMPDTKARMICNRLPSHVQLPLRRFVRVLKSSPFLRRFFPAAIAAPLGMAADAFDRLVLWGRLSRSARVGEWLDDFDNRFDRLWERYDKTGKIIARRDERVLRWRFRQQPGHTYRIFIVRSRARNDIETYFICEEFGQGWAVKDCLSTAKDADLHSDLLLLARAARAEGAASLDVYIIADERWTAALHKARFACRSNRPFFAVGAPSLQGRLDGHSWYITQADEDI
jgi:hypothetical protein